MAAAEAVTRNAAEEPLALYEDAFISLTSSSLTIRKYYFPVGTSKVVQVADIERIWLGTDPELGLNFFKKKSWGIGLLVDTWWAFCALREANDDRCNFVIRARGDGFFRHGFSVERPNEALRALRQVAPDALQ